MTETVPQRACPVGWEQDPRIDDGHDHQWQMVVINPRGKGDPAYREAMTVCRVCGAPRCGSTFVADPCLRRRHHREDHAFESGRTEPIGGVGG